MLSPTRPAVRRAPPMPPPRHHPPEALLVDYAAGASGEAEALIVATHLAFCPECRAAVAAAEAVGGALLAELEPAAVDPGMFEAVVARLHQPEPSAAAEPVEGPFPEPLRSTLGAPPEALAWRAAGPGRAYCRLSVGSAPVDARLLRLGPGRAIPRHSHYGHELVLVLEGAYSDVNGHYRVGDFCVNDGAVDHRPVADSDGPCTCLIVRDGPMRLTGPVGRLLNPVLKV